MANQLFASAEEDVRYPEIDVRSAETEDFRSAAPVTAASKIGTSHKGNARRQSEVRERRGRPPRRHVPAGGTFWLRRNRFEGSYRALISANRSHVVALLHWARRRFVGQTRAHEITSSP